MAARSQYVHDQQSIEIIPIETKLPKRRSKSKEAKRGEPINMVLMCEKILNTFGIRQRPWRGELTRLIEMIEKDD